MSKQPPTSPRASRLNGGGALVQRLLCWAESGVGQPPTEVRSFAHLLSPPATRAYARLVVYEDAETELLLVRWAAGRWCAPHDHGGAGCRLYPLEGDLLEARYTLDAGSLHEESSKPIEINGEVPAAAWHAMMSPGGALSLHVYSSPKPTMRVLDVKGERTLTVRSSHGAFVPAVADVLEEQAWA